MPESQFEIAPIPPQKVRVLNTVIILLGPRGAYLIQGLNQLIEGRDLTVRGAYLKLGVIETRNFG